jgi:hypothetical protein
MSNYELEEQEPMPWERQCGETLKSYGFFKIYLDLGRIRSLKKVSEITGKSLRSIAGFSTRNDWFERAEEFDFWEIDKEAEKVKIELDCNTIRQFQQKIDISNLAQEMMEYIIPHLNNFGEKYNNPEVLKKVKFVKLITNTMVELNKVVHFALGSKLVNDLMEKDLKDIKNIHRNRLKPGSGSNSDDESNFLTDNMRDFMKRLKFEDNKIILPGGEGYADLEYDIENPPVITDNGVRLSKDEIKEIKAYFSERDSGKIKKIEKTDAK